MAEDLVLRHAHTLRPLLSTGATVDGPTIHAAASTLVVVISLILALVLQQPGAVAFSLPFLVQLVVGALSARADSFSIALMPNTSGMWLATRPNLWLA